MDSATGVLRRRRVTYGVVAWLLFASAWGLVFLRDPGAWLDGLLVPFVTVVVVAVVTLAWVRHNLAIYRRKGPRQGRPTPPEDWPSDSLGRPLTFTPRARTARVVSVSLRDGVKHFRAIR